MVPLTGDNPPNCPNPPFQPVTQDRGIIGLFDKVRLGSTTTLCRPWRDADGFSQDNATELRPQQVTRKVLSPSLIDHRRRTSNVRRSARKQHSYIKPWKCCSQSQTEQISGTLLQLAVNAANTSSYTVRSLLACQGIGPHLRVKS